MKVTTDEALSIIEAARRMAGEAGVAMTFAIVDAGGHLLALARMDGAPWPTVEVAIGKAWTAAAWQMPSADQAGKARDLPQFAAAMSAASGGRYTPQDGGIPILRDGEVVGGAGASGSTGRHDAELIARATGSVLGGAGG